MATLKKINISQVDVIFANGSYPIEFLLYYKDRLTAEQIRSALRELAPTFWPMFGEYDAGVIRFDGYSEKQCFDEDVVDQEFNSGEASMDIYKKYRHAVPSGAERLFFLKMIQYKNGTVLIPKLNHLAGDGYSYFYFLSALAATTRDHHASLRRRMARALRKPHHRRTILKEFRFNEIELEPVQDTKTPAIEFEEISRSSVRNIIKDVASRFGRRISTNDFLSAMAVKRSVGIQGEHFGDNFRLTIPIDIRGHIKEYGPRYFGNGLMFNEINFRTKDIENKGPDKIAAEIRKCMPGSGAQGGAAEGKPHGISSINMPPLRGLGFFDPAFLRCQTMFRQQQTGSPAQRMASRRAMSEVAEVAQGICRPFGAWIFLGLVPGARFAHPRLPHAALRATIPLAGARRIHGLHFLFPLRI